MPPAGLTQSLPLLSSPGRLWSVLSTSVLLRGEMGMLLPLHQNCGKEPASGHGTALASSGLAPGGAAALSQPLCSFPDAHLPVLIHFLDPDPSPSGVQQITIDSLA